MIRAVETVAGYIGEEHILYSFKSVRVEDAPFQNRLEYLSAELLRSQFVLIL